MYHHDNTGWLLTAIFVPSGLLLAAAGRWVKVKFRDPNEGKHTFQHMTLTPRALLEFAGIGMIYFGLFFAVFGFVFPFILR